MKSTRDEAIKMAKALKPNITDCEEWKSAYVFYNEGETENVGGASPVVVMKDTMQAVTYGTFLGIAPEDDDVVDEFKV